MEKSRLKEIFIKFRDSGDTPKNVGVSARRAYKRLKKLAPASAGRRDISDNFYLIDEAFAEVKRGGRLGREELQYCRYLLSFMTPESVEGDISAFFEVFADLPLFESEAYWVRGGLLYSAIGELSTNEKFDINVLRALLSLDFTPFLLGYNKSEQILRKDSVYARCDKETRALYRKKIEAYAHRRAIGFGEACTRLVEEATARGCHIGELLEFGKTGERWLFLGVLVFLSLLYLVRIILWQSVGEGVGSLVLVLSLVPLWQGSMEIMGIFVSLFKKPEILPRLDMWKIPEEYATLSVIASLASSKEEVEKLFEHLELLSLKTQRRGRDEYAFWGVLLDLPESDSERGEHDDEILGRAVEITDALNKRYGDKFVFFTRERRYDSEKKKYVPHERKRGAIVELVKLLKTGESTVCTKRGCTPSVKYVVVLDSDTDMELGALNKMVGTAAHPMNAPRLSKRGGATVVTQGFGVLQPAIITNMASSKKSRFASLLSGVGGIDFYHSSIFNLNNALFGEGIFCGKGIFDIDAYYKALCDTLPNNIILSHDILEGTRLRCGYLPDIRFFDSVPSNVIAYYQRAHRWARGDVQLMKFLPRKVDSFNGKIVSPLLSHQRFVFFQNFLALTDPIFKVLIFLVIMKFQNERLMLCVALLLLPQLLPLLRAVARTVTRGRISDIARRFFTDSLNSILREFVLFGYYLSSLPFVAFKCADAVLRSFWRMFVSKKKLLEWNTASQGERASRGAAGVFAYTLPSLVFGLFFLVLGVLSFSRLLGILSLVFPVITYYLSKPSPKRSCPAAYKEKISGYARDMWRYFDKYVDSTGNYLPPDNVSLFPSGEVAYRTSPTNIGLYLLCILCALDFSFINLTDALARIEKTVESIEKMKKYKGHLYNWYNILTLEVIGEDYVSTVDSGNFTVSLVALYEGLREYEKKDKRVGELCERIKAIELGADFRALFNNSKGLFYLGYFVSEEKPDSIMYDMYMSEMRSTDYYAIGRGIVRENHWSALSRPVTANLFGVGMLSWSGTAFEYFMPHLLLPVYKNSFAEEALSFTFAEQVKYGARVNGQRFFGISESGYYAFDEALGYQYRAFGVPSVSRRRERSMEMVYSPYSTFLMMRSNYYMCMKNLESLKKIGMYGECGFFEAIDLTPARTPKPAIVKSFMSHHIGMSLVACANAVFDDIFVRRFMKDVEMRAVGELLKEAVPTEVGNVKIKNHFTESPQKIKLSSSSFESSLRSSAVMTALTGRETSLVLFERGVVSLDISFQRGEPVSAIRPLDATHSPSLFLFALCDGKVYSPTISPDVSVMCSESYCEYRQGHLKAGISLSAKTPALRIKMEAEAREGEVGLYFEPLLCDKESFLSHPAFSNLFIKATVQEGVLVMTRVYERPYSLALFCTSPYTFEYCRENLSRDNPLSTPLNTAENVNLHLPISPCVFAKSKFHTRTDTTFVVGFGRTPSEALANGKEELLQAFSKSQKLSSDLFYSALVASGAGDFNRDVFESLLQVFRPTRERTFKTGEIVCYGKGGVYSLGISGNYPVFLIRQCDSEDVLKAFFICHKFHYIMGLRYELLIEVTEDGYLKGSRGNIESLLIELGCSFMLSKSGGIHLVGSNKASSDMLLSLASAVYPSENHIKKYNEIFYKVKEERVTPKECGEMEFVIDKSQVTPPLEWHHIIAGRTFGTMLSHKSLGNTWMYNSGLSRLTFWENDSINKNNSETVIMEKDGELIDLVASAGEVRFGCGAAEYNGRYFSVNVAIHPTLMFKIVRVNVENSDISLFYRMLPILDARLFPTSKIEYSVDKNSVIFKNVFSEYFKEGFGYILLPFESSVKISESGFGVHCKRGGDVVFVLGYAHCQRHYEYVKKYFESHRFSDVREASVAPLGELLKNEKCFFVTYQTLVSRFFARSGPYQSSGAWGFRDQTQDCLALLDFSPALVRSHIARLACHQYLEGDVQHWWHSRRGVRTNCSDDYLWFVWLASIYVLRTGDRSILDLRVPCLLSAPLNESEKDRYEIAEKSGEKFTILEHMRFALDNLVRRGVGAHGLPYILSGDWNDSMNMLPVGSESVWLAFFARIVIFYYQKVTDDDSYNSFSLSLRDSIEKNAFFSDRYARAFLPDGRVLGVEGSEYFEIDSLPQSFASLCHKIIGDGNVSRISLALNTAWNNLFDGEKKIWRLFTPPLCDFDKNIGYLSAYPEGVRENGGQYTHAAVWAAEGFLYAPENKEENLKRAKLLAYIINPENHKTEEYKAEPYVLAGDVYTDGHGGWSWYTGSAAWYRDLILRLSDKNRNIEAPFS